MVGLEVLEQRAGAEPDEYGQQAEEEDLVGCGELGEDREGEEGRVCGWADEAGGVFVCQYGSWGAGSPGVCGEEGGRNGVV